MASGEHKFRNRCVEVYCRLTDNYGNPLYGPDDFKQFVEEHKDIIVSASLLVHNLDRYTIDDCYKDEDGVPLPKPADGAPPTLPDSNADPQIVGSGYLGDLKAPHLHGPIRFTNQRSYDELAKIIGLPYNCLQQPTAKYRGLSEEEVARKAFDAMSTYITHKDPRQQAKGKHRYEDSEVWTYNYDYTANTDAYLASRTKANGRQRKKSEVHALINALYAGETTVAEIISEYGYAFYLDYQKKFDKASQAYFHTDAYEMPHRTNFLIGPTPDYAREHPNEIGGIGKTMVGKQLIYGLYPELSKSESLHEVIDLDVPFDEYEGQRAILLDEARPGELISRFGLGKILSVTALHPGKSSVNIKYDHSLLRHETTVLAGVDPPMVSMNKLAGKYVDRRGEQHDPEALSQICRRFPFYIELTDKMFYLYFNVGYVTGRHEDIIVYKRGAEVRLNTIAIMRTYDARCKNVALQAEREGWPKERLQQELDLLENDLRASFSKMVEAVKTWMSNVVEAQMKLGLTIDDIAPDDEPIMTIYSLEDGLTFDPEHPDGWYRDNPELEAERLAKIADAQERAASSQAHEDDWAWLCDHFEYFNTYVPLYMQATRNRLGGWEYVNSFKEWSYGETHLLFPKSAHEPRVNGFDRPHMRFYHMKGVTNGERECCKERMKSLMAEPFPDKHTREVLDEFCTHVHDEFDNFDNFQRDRLRGIVKDYETFMSLWAKELGLRESSKERGISFDDLFPDD